MFQTPQVLGAPSKRSLPNGALNTYNGNTAKKPKIIESDVPDALLDDGLDDALSQVCEEFTASQAIPSNAETERKEDKFIDYRDIILADIRKLNLGSSASSSSSSDKTPPFNSEKKLETLDWGLDELVKFFPDISQIKKCRNTLRKLRQQAEDPMDTEEVN